MKTWTARMTIAPDRTPSAARSRRARVLYGAITASMAIAAAAVAHVVAGGQIPGPIGVLAPWMLAVMVCTLISTTRMSVWRIVIGAIIAQVLFHLLFAVGATGWSFSGAHAHAAMTMYTPAPMVNTTMNDAAMIFAHSIAAIATVVIAIATESALSRKLSVKPSTQPN